MRKYIFIVFVWLLTSLSTFCSLANDCNPPSASIDLDINNVRAKLLNGGDKFWDVLGTGNAAYEIPKGSGKHSMFSAAIWIAALDQSGNLYTAAQTYRQSGTDFWPGELNALGETQFIDCKEGDKMYSVYGTEVVNAKIGKGIAYNVSRWPAHIANYFDANNDGIYDPSLGDYPLLDNNKPNLIPGQMVFWTMNDKGNVHTAIPNSLSMGIEIQITAYAFPSNTSNAINNSTFYRYKIINKSANLYPDFHVGEFGDSDLGNPSDDYVGCDLSTNGSGKKRNLFYTYNGDPTDEDGVAPGYGINPAAIGMCFLETGLDSLGAKLEMNSFINFTNTGTPGVNADPRNPIELIRYLRGFWADGFPIQYGSNDGRTGNDPYNFVFPGDTDPNGKTAWYETTQPSDRRMLAAIKPKSFAPGEQMTVELAYVWAQDLSSTPPVIRPSLELLRLSTDTVIEAYSNGFNEFTTVVKNTVKSKFNVYPNPGKDVLFIDFDDKITTISIYDISGKLIKTIQNTNTRKVDIGDLDNGTYLIKVNNSAVRFMKM